MLWLLCNHICQIWKHITVEWTLKLVIVSLQAEVLWITCWEDFIHLKKEVGDLDLCLPKESYRKTNEISSEIGSIARENIQKLISSCYPHLKENVLHCLRKNNFPFNALKEEGDSKIWHVTYMGSLSSRRYLGQVFPQHVSEISIKEDESPKKNKPKEKDSNKKDKKKSKSSGSKDKNKNTSMAITIIVTILVAALLFLCCGSGRVRQNDERPLLSMSMNDYSVGTYEKISFFKTLLMSHIYLQAHLSWQNVLQCYSQVLLPIIIHTKIQWKRRKLGFNHQVIHWLMTGRTQWWKLN